MHYRSGVTIIIGCWCCTCRCFCSCNCFCITRFIRSVVGIVATGCTTQIQRKHTAIATTATLLVVCDDNIKHRQYVVSHYYSKDTFFTVANSTLYFSFYYSNCIKLHAFVSPVSLKISNTPFSILSRSVYYYSIGIFFTF